MQHEDDSEDGSSVQSGLLWNNYVALESDITYSVSLANKYIRQKISENTDHSESHSSIGSARDVEKQETAYTIPGLKKPELPVFSGDRMQFSDLTEMFNAFVLSSTAIKFRLSLTRAPLGGGADSAPLSNSRTDGRRKTGKTATESFQQDES